MPRFRSTLIGWNQTLTANAFIQDTPTRWSSERDAYCFEHTDGQCVWSLEDIEFYEAASARAISIDLDAEPLGEGACGVVRRAQFPRLRPRVQSRACLSQVTVHRRKRSISHGLQSILMSYPWSTTSQRVIASTS